MKYAIIVMSLICSVARSQEKLSDSELGSYQDQAMNLIWDLSIDLNKIISSNDIQMQDNAKILAMSHFISDSIFVEVSSLKYHSIHHHRLKIYLDSLQEVRTHLNAVSLEFAAVFIKDKFTRVKGGYKGKATYVQVVWKRDGGMELRTPLDQTIKDVDIYITLKEVPNGQLRRLAWVVSLGKISVQHTSKYTGKWQK